MNDKQHTVLSIVGVLQSHLARRPKPDLSTLTQRTIIGRARALVACCDVPLVTGGAQPAYDPDGDEIYMPAPGFYCLARLWKRPKRYAIDILHELIHATGHRSRLARPRHSTWGDATYQREELIAEIGSALLMHDLGISGRPILPHAKYLSSWLGGLENPALDLDLAMSRANQAAGYVAAIARRYAGKQPQRKVS